MSETLVKATNLGCFFWQPQGLFKRSKFWALEDVSFDIQQGETLGLVGRNGAGKSTLLQILAHIINPDRGKIERGPYRASLLSINAGLQPNLTGRQNAVLSGMLLGLSKKDIAKRLEDIAAFSELNDFFDRPVNTYSSGMRARLGFSTAAQLDPEVMLIDEIIGVGDLPFRQKSRKVIEDRMRSDRTVVIVSHDNKLIRDLCDRALWIENGHTHALGPAKSVMDDYVAAVQQQPPAVLAT